MPEQLALFEQGKLREIVLSRGSDGVFVLSFWLASESALEPVDQAAELPVVLDPGALIPDYVSVEVA